MRFYTNAALRGNKILFRGYENGHYVQKAIEYSPYLYVPSKNPYTKFKTLNGDPVERLDFDSPRDAREFTKKYEDVSNFNFYGITNYVYQFLNDNYTDTVEYDSDLIRIANIDIEVHNQGQSIEDTIALATAPVTAITVTHKNVIYAFGSKPYKVSDKRVKYHHARDEEDLLLKFLDVWQTINPDVITGWNVEMFDIPFLVNRLKNLLGNDFAKRLSPWGILDEKTVLFNNKEQQVFVPLGVTILDYLQLYKKFTYVEQESYKLDHIAYVELNQRKLDYSDVNSLYDLYEKDFQRFMDYNIRDVELVEKLDNKLGLMNQIFAIAYDARVNFADGFTSVRLWDIIIHNYLHRNNTVVPQYKPVQQDQKIVGGFVKDPIIGMHKWVVSFDLNSLYPHLIMQYNISPETLVHNAKLPVTVDDILAGSLNRDDYRRFMKEHDVAVAATGYMFRRDKRGFLPELMETMYNERSVFKKKMLAAEQEYEQTKNSELVRVISQAHNMQLAKKIQLNSAYGALANLYFRWFDNRLAESVTMSGQLSIRWMEGKMNEYLNKRFKTDGVDYVIACDTDSMYITLDKLVEQTYDGNIPETSKVVDFLNKVAERVFEPFIDESYADLAEYVNAYQQKMVMKREVIADKAIWTGKKYYILNVWNSEGVSYAEPKLKMKGIAAVKSTTPIVCRAKLKESFKIIMTKDEETLQKYIKDFKGEFMALPYEEVATPRGIKQLSKYRFGDDRIPIHVRGSLVYNKAIKDNKLSDRYPLITNGDKIKYCYLKMPNPLHHNVISVPGILPRQLGIEQYLDYETQWEKAFISPLRDVLDVIQWSIEKKATLDNLWA